MLASYDEKDDESHEIPYEVAHCEDENVPEVNRRGFHDPSLQGASAQTSSNSRSGKML